MSNIFKLPEQIPQKEIFETIVNSNDIIIERIISTGQITPSGEWYDQKQDEWVIVLQGEAQLSYLDGSIIKLKPGDYVFIEAHQKHRVEYTSANPPCIWLAVHGQLKTNN